MGVYLMSVFDCLTRLGAGIAEMNRGQIGFHFAVQKCLFKRCKCFQNFCGAASQTRFQPTVVLAHCLQPPWKSLIVASC